MGDLTKNISRYEIACRCGCGFNTIDYEVVQIVQETADYFAQKRGIKKSIVDITSGARCKKHNKKEGGKLKSLHLLARAIDFRIRGVPPKKVTAYLRNKYPNRLGIGRYKNFTHIDTKSGHARRWGG